MRVTMISGFNGAAWLILMELCSSAHLSDHQRSSLSAGRGPHRSDLHLREIERQEVALPWLPVDALREREREREWRRDWEGLMEQVQTMWGAKGPVKFGSGTADKAKQQTLINTSLWFHFTGVKTCFRCYCIPGTNTMGGTFTAAILWMKSWQEQKSSPAFPSELLFAILLLPHLIPGKKEIMAGVLKCFSSPSWKNSAISAATQQFKHKTKRSGWGQAKWKQPLIIC